MQNNFYFVQHLVNERMEALMKDAERHRMAKEYTASLPVRRPLLKRIGRVFLTAAAAIQGWGVRRHAIRGCAEPEVN
jgi:hypothetical protein